MEEEDVTFRHVFIQLWNMILEYHQLADTVPTGGATLPPAEHTSFLVGAYREFFSSTYGRIPNEADNAERLATKVRRFGASLWEMEQAIAMDEWSKD